MLVLLHALIPCLAALPSSPVLLQYVYTALVSLLFGTIIPTSFNFLMEMFYSLVSLFFLLYSCLQIQYVSPTHFAGCGHVKRR